MAVTIEDLGITQEELTDRVVQRIADRFLLTTVPGEDGEEWDDDSTFAKNVKREVQSRIDKAVTDLADRHIMPNVTSYIESLTLQETNKWGEKKGESVSFIEYLVQRAEAYMQEKVNWDGHSKEESRDSYSWSGKQTRITHAIHKHLHHHIEQAVKHMLAEANKQIAGGLEATVKTKLQEVLAALKVEVNTGR